MATTAQIHANQTNSKLSTGPSSDSGKTASAQNATRHGFTVSDETLAHRHSEEMEAIAADYRRQFPVSGALANHLRSALACATIRQALLENAFLVLIETLEIDDPALARVERYRAAAERSFYKALKELQALVRNEANSAPPSKPEPTATEPQPTAPKLTMAELRAKYPNRDRNELARMLAGVPPRRA